MTIILEPFYAGDPRHTIEMNDPEFLTFTLAPGSHLQWAGPKHSGFTQALEGTYSLVLNLAQIARKDAP